MIACTGRPSGFKAKEWSMEGRTGIARTLDILDAGETVSVKITEECWRDLPTDTRQVLEGDPDALLGYRVTFEMNSAFKANNAQRFELAPYGAGTLAFDAAAGASGRTVKSAA